MLALAVPPIAGTLDFLIPRSHRRYSVIGILSTSVIATIFGIGQISRDTDVSGGSAFAEGFIIAGLIGLASVLLGAVLLRVSRG